MRKIVEEPDIMPATGRRSRVPTFGNPLATAIGQFSVRTLLRSRQHRLMFAFYLGIGFAATIFFVKAPATEQLAGSPGTAWLGSSILVMGLSVVGTRVAFALPIDLRANWVFRIMPIQSAPGSLTARRRALLRDIGHTVWAGSAILFLSTWPLQFAAQHLIILALIGIIAAELCLRGPQKIPFTCSYLPGKSNFNITFLISTVSSSWRSRRGRIRAAVFRNSAMYGTILAGLTALALAVCARSSESELQFEQTSEPAIFMLDLHRDGITPLPPA